MSTWVAGALAALYTVRQSDDLSRVDDRVEDGRPNLFARFATRLADHGECLTRTYFPLEVGGGHAKC